MTEWSVVGVIAALISLIAGIGAPIIKLNSNITRLNVTIENIIREQREQKEENGKSHERIWRELHSHNGTLTAHDRRLAQIEMDRKTKE